MAETDTPKPARPLPAAGISERKKRVATREVLERDQIVSRLTARLVALGSQRKGGRLFKTIVIGLGITLTLAALAALAIWLLWQPDESTLWLRQLLGGSQP